MRPCKFPLFLISNSNICTFSTSPTAIFSFFRLSYKATTRHNAFYGDPCRALLFGKLFTYTFTVKSKYMSINIYRDLYMLSQLSSTYKYICFQNLSYMTADRNPGGGSRSRFGCACSPGDENPLPFTGTAFPKTHTLCRYNFSKKPYP